MLIYINQKTHVLASAITKIEGPDSNERIIVTTSSGERHTYETDYGQSVWRAKDKLIQQVNAALSPQP